MKLETQLADAIAALPALDADIDRYDPTDVGHALATRFRAERDIISVPGLRSDRAQVAVELATR